MSNGTYGIIITRKSREYQCSVFDDEQSFDSVISYLSGSEGMKLDFEMVSHVKVSEKYLNIVDRRAHSLAERATRGEEIDFQKDLEDFCSERCR